MSAVAEQVEQYVAPTPQGTLFLSRRRELRLVRVPTETLYGPNGRKIGEQQGETIKFLDGRYLSTDPEVTAWLRGHWLLGDVHEGLWEVDPVAPTVSQAEIAALVHAMSNVDLDLLQKIIEQEEQGWARPALLEPARQGLVQMQTLIAEHNAKQAAEESPARVTPKPKA